MTEALSLVLSTQVGQLTTICNPVSRIPVPSWPPTAPAHIRVHSCSQTQWECPSSSWQLLFLCFEYLGFLTLDLLIFYSTFHNTLQSLLGGISAAKHRVDAWGFKFWVWTITWYGATIILSIMGFFFPLQVLCTSCLSPSPMQSHLKMR